MAKWKNILDIGLECTESFIHPDKTPEIFDIGIQIAGISELKEHYKVGYASPSTHTILYTIQGKGLLHTNNGCQTIEPNTMTFIPCKEGYLMELEDNNWTMCWLQLRIDQHWISLNKKPIHIDYCEQTYQIYHLLSTIYYEKKSELRNSIITLLQKYLIETLSTSNQTLNPDRKIELLFQEIENKLHYPWTVNKMSKKIHYSAPHIHRLCQNYFNRSPMQQLIFLRIKRAQYLLKHTDWPNKHIAEYIGYSDVLTFYKRFKNSIGITPSEYRKKNQ